LKLKTADVCKLTKTLKFWKGAGCRLMTEQWHNLNISLIHHLCTVQQVLKHSKLVSDYCLLKHCDTATLPQQ
jgi:hypothetical protein